MKDIKHFIACCNNVGLKYTHRQMRKFENKRGLAYNVSVRLDTWFKDSDKTVRFQQALKVSNDSYSQKV